MTFIFRFYVDYYDIIVLEIKPCKFESKFEIWRLKARYNQRGCREVVCYEYFVAIIPVFSTFSNFFKKKIIKAILCNFSMRLLKYLNFFIFFYFFDPQNMKKTP